MFKQLFGWIDQHHWAYWIPAYAGLAVIVAMAIWAGGKSGRERPWLWCLAIFGSILLWRWPFLFTADEFNPDEPQLIAGALTLWLKDPVFGRAVDGTTSGPLNFYALWYARLFGLPIDFFSARLLVIALSAGAVFAASQALRLFTEPRIARLAVLPAACFFAFNTEHQLIHYASEYVSLFLVAVGFSQLLAAVESTRRDAVGRWASAGFLLGLAPWAKFQVVPIVVPLLLWGFWHAIRRDEQAGPQPAAFNWRRGRVLLIAAIAPAAAVVVAVAAFDLWVPLHVGYIQYGKYYLQTGGGYAPWDLLVIQWGQVSGVPLVQNLLWGLLVALLASGICLAVNRTQPRRSFWAALIFFGGSFVAVLAPQRPFMHYVLYIIVPATLLAGMAMGEAWRSVAGKRWPRVMLLVALAAPFVILLGAQLTLPGPFMLGRLQQHWREPRTALGRALRPLVKPGEPIAVWGWRARAYLENGNVQATRCAHSERMILDSPLRDYHRDRYLRDFAASAPRVFVDATGPGVFAYEDRARFGHETFPALRDMIARDFELLCDVGDARVYVRRHR
jgi:hypothetical protein